MRTPTDRQDLVEARIYFPVGNDVQAGLLTRTRGDAGDEVMVLAPGNDAYATGRSAPEMCHTVARRGLATFRFENLELDRADPSQLLSSPCSADLIAAVEALRGFGMRRFDLVGLSFGSWAALLAAPEIEGLERVAFVSFPPRLASRTVFLAEGSEDTLPALLRALVSRVGLLGLLRDPATRRAVGQVAVAPLRARASTSSASTQRTGGTPQQLVEALGRLAASSTRTLFLYSARAPDYRLFRDSLEGALGDTLRASPTATVDVVAVDHRMEHFRRRSVPQALADRLADWLADEPSEVLA